MAFGPELIARLGLDWSEFQRGMSQAVSHAGGLGQALHRKLGVKDAFKSMVTALSIDVHSIAEKIAEAWAGGTMKGLEEVRDLYEREGQLIEQNMLNRMNDAQKKAFVKREIQRATDELNRPRGSKTVKQFNPFTGKQEDSSVFTEGEVDFEKRQAAARVRLRELEGMEQGQQKKDREDTASLDKQIADTKEKTARAGLSSAEKLFRLQKQMVDAHLEIDKTEEGSVKRKEAELKYAQAALSAEEARLEYERDIAAEVKERVADGEKILKQYQNQAEAVLRLAGASNEAYAGAAGAHLGLATARDDALKVSVSEAAAGGGGILNSSRVKARRILSLEARAKAAMQSGFGATAGRLQSEAESLRASSGFLTSSDRDPLAGAKDAIVKSESHLKDIRESLKEEMAKK